MPLLLVLAILGILFYLGLVVLWRVSPALRLGYYPKEPCLANIKQVTFSDMGFAKAGEAYFSPDGASILFQAVPAGEKHYQIYGMDVVQGNLSIVGIPRLVSVASKGRACTCAFFHPYKPKIIFASSHSDPFPVRPDIPREGGGYKWDLTPYMNIYEANPDGTGLKALTSGPSYHAECAFSPTGEQIVYASNENETNSMNLYIMDSNGSHVRALTSTVGCYNGGPFFSPDGTHVVFRADRAKRDYLQIYMIHVASGLETQLTDNAAVNWAPYWHPDGDKIAFTTSLHGHHQYEIYLLHVGTRVLHRITNSPSFDGLPVFNADGTKMMWTSKRSADQTCQVFTADFFLPPKSQPKGSHDVA